jgi:hypothetical protein
VTSRFGSEAAGEPVADAILALRRLNSGVEEHAVTVFAPMDEWIAAGGRTDAWLQLGLDLLESWQDLEDAVGQAHLQAVLGALGALRPTRPPAPDPVALAVWFHHPQRENAVVALTALAGPDVAVEVDRLVRVLGRHHPDRADLPGTLLCAAHRAAVSGVHLAAVPVETQDQ